VDLLTENKVYYIGALSLLNHIFNAKLKRSTSTAKLKVLHGRCLNMQATVHTSPLAPTEAELFNTSVFHTETAIGRYSLRQV
jgi:hypothetical protein